MSTAKDLAGRKPARFDYYVWEKLSLDCPTTVTDYVRCAKMAKLSRIQDPLHRLNKNVGKCTAEFERMARCVAGACLELFPWRCGRENQEIVAILDQKYDDLDARRARELQEDEQRRKRALSCRESQYDQWLVKSGQKRAEVDNAFSSNYGVGVGDGQRGTFGQNDNRYAGNDSLFQRRESGPVRPPNHGQAPQAGIDESREASRAQSAEDKVLYDYSNPATQQTGIESSRLSGTRGPAYQDDGRRISPDSDGTDNRGYGVGTRDGAGSGGYNTVDKSYDGTNHVNNVDFNVTRSSMPNASGHVYDWVEGAYYPSQPQPMASKLSKAEAALNSPGKTGKPSALGSTATLGGETETQSEEFSKEKAVSFDTSSINKGTDSPDEKMTKKKSSKKKKSSYNPHSGGRENRRGHMKGEFSSWDEEMDYLTYEDIIHPRVWDNWQRCTMQEFRNGFRKVVRDTVEMGYTPSSLSGMKIDQLGRR